MASVYMSAESINKAIDYFSGIHYTSPEQIGLFFLFKSMKYNSKEYQPFSREPGIKRENTRMLYYLSGLFQASNEKGGKRTGLFPFSISPRIKASSYYNGGTEFRGLYNRIKDTMDNTLIDDGKYLKKDELNPDTFKFTPDYIELLRENFLNGHKIPLKYFAAWYFRFHEFEVNDDWCANPTVERFEDFTRICTKKLISILHLTPTELNNLFDTETGILKYQNTSITGEELRELLTYDSEAAIPEVTTTAQPVEYMDTASVFTADEINDLVTPHGNNITAEKLLELLLATKQVVLSGPPGTGKSYISNQIKSHFDEEYLVQFHPNLTYEQFIGGYTFSENGAVNAKAGLFLEFCEKARTNTDKKYLFLIDEINRGNVSKAFGEIILTLDREYTAKLPTELKTAEGCIISEFSIPDNLYILATMNSADRSIALVDYAIRRRFAFVNFYPNSEVLDYISDTSSLSDIKIGNLMTAINEKLFSVLGDADLLLGQSYFIPKWAIHPVTKKIMWSEEVLMTLFNYYILPIIEEYTYGNTRYLIHILGDKLPSRLADPTEFMQEINIQFGS